MAVKKRKKNLRLDVMISSFSPCYTLCCQGNILALERALSLVFGKLIEVKIGEDGILFTNSRTAARVLRPPNP